ncbi:MAG: CapA family protein [Myxococcales bacterium]|nr:CapA family protein [Myxococcales bacterium]
MSSVLDSDRRVAGLVYGLLGVLLIVALVLFENSPEQSRALLYKTGIDGLTWRRMDTPPFFGMLSGAAALGLVVAAFLRRTALWGRPGVKLGGRIALIALLLISGFSWLYGARGIPRNDYIKAWDSFHYVLGPKYFDELGYFALYDCVAQADIETVKVLEGLRVRDLRDYRYTMPRDKAAARGRCDERFSPERWAQFKRDYVFYTGITDGILDNMVKDRGYNGTPAHVFISGTLLNAFETNYRNLTFATLGDTLVVLSMFYALSLAFGWELAGLMAILFFSLFSDRGHFIHGSFFRYHWLYCIGFALAALKRERHGQAGAWVAAAGMLNVFPVLFGLGIAFKALWELIQTRTLSQRYRRFIAGAALASVLLGGLGMAHGQGVGNYTTFLRNMDQHAGVLSISRVGLKYDFLWRGELHRDRHSFMYTRLEAKRTRHVHRAALAVLTLVLFIAVRRMDDVDATALTGFAAFFYIFTTVSYYYGIYALLLLLLRKRLDRPLTWVLMAMPFALNVAVAWLFEHSGYSLGVANNTGMSFAVTVVLFAYQWARLGEPLAERFDGWLRRLARGGIAVAAVAIVVLCWLWSAPTKVAAEPADTPRITFGGPDDPRAVANDRGSCAPMLHQSGGQTIALVQVRFVRDAEARDAHPGCALVYGRRGAMLKRLRPVFQKAREQGQRIVVDADWNRGRMRSRGKRQRRLARALSRAGADAVVGRSQRSLLGVTLDRGKPIVDALPLDAHGQRITLSFDPSGVRRITIQPRPGRADRMWLRSAEQGTLLAVIDGKGYLEL